MHIHVGVCRGFTSCFIPRTPYIFCVSLLYKNDTFHYFLCNIGTEQNEKKNEKVIKVKPPQKTLAPEDFIADS